MSILTVQAVTMALWTKDAEGKNNYTDLGCTAVAGNENPGCDPPAPVPPRPPRPALPRARSPLPCESSDHRCNRPLELLCLSRVKQPFSVDLQHCCFCCHRLHT